MAGNKDYVCKECGYKFKTSRQDTHGMKCPYCGSAKVDKYEPTLAEDLLNSVGD